MRRLKYYLKLLLFLGNKHLCPCCYYSARKWREKGRDSEASLNYKIVGMGRRRVKCPRCNSAERTRHLQLWLTENQYASPVLGISPDKWLKVRGDYTTLDIQPGKADITGDIRELPFEDNKFGLIICSHVLEHIDDDIKAMKELYRVLKPKGTLLAPVPFSTITPTIEGIDDGTEEDRLKKYGQVDHVRVYNLNEYISRLNSVGFTVTEVYKLGETAKKFGINEEEPLIVCYKV